MTVAVDIPCSSQINTTINMQPLFSPLFCLYRLGKQKLTRRDKSTATAQIVPNLFACDRYCNIMKLLEQSARTSSPIRNSSLIMKVLVSLGLIHHSGRNTGCPRDAHSAAYFRRSGTTKAWCLCIYDRVTFTIWNRDRHQLLITQMENNKQCLLPRKGDLYLEVIYGLNLIKWFIYRLSE